jgi:hypothetical protein
VYASVLYVMISPTVDVKRRTEGVGLGIREVGGGEMLCMLGEVNLEGVN